MVADPQVPAVAEEPAALNRQGNQESRWRHEALEYAPAVGHELSPSGCERSLGKDHNPPFAIAVAYSIRATR